MTQPEITHSEASPVRHTEWRNWRWQMQHRVHDEESLRQYIHPTEDELAAIEATRDIFRWNL